MSKKLKCWICGTEHDYCPTCGETHGWKYVADRPSCYQIYMTLESFNSGTMNQREAIEAFAENDVCVNSDLSWMLPQIEKKVRNIIGEKKKETKTIKKTKLFE